MYHPLRFVTVASCNVSLNGDPERLRDALSVVALRNMTAALVYRRQVWDPSITARFETRRYLMFASVVTVAKCDASRKQGAPVY